MFTQEHENNKRTVFLICNPSGLVKNKLKDTALTRFSVFPVSATGLMKVQKINR